MKRKKDLNMATAKKTTAKAETKTAAKKTAAKAETKTTAAKKTTATKAAATKTATKTTAAKKTEPKFDLYIQFGGATVSVADIEKNVKKVVKGKKAYTVYVKPEESKAYIVADGETTGMDVFFVAD
ncbi:MAG: hypothetical protein IJ171_08225 [Ruminococcus sp.]|nr:hypothetical protein [Ruminococcus sp.]